MESKKQRKERTNITYVSHITKILRMSEDFLSIAPEKAEKDLVRILKNLRNVLKPYEKLEASEFLGILKNLLKNREKIKVAALFGEQDIEKVSLENVKSLIKREDLETKELLFIANKRLEMPIGVLKKMKKELIKQKILNTIENIDKLDTIQKMASK